MAFKRGQSGNPNGRPKGIQDRHIELRELLVLHNQSLIEKTVELVKSGDTTALRLRLERTMAPNKHFGGDNVTKVTPEKKAKFLSVLAEGGSVTQAARAIGMARKNIYAWRNKDEQSKADWEDAVEQGMDCLEDEVGRGAKDHSNSLLIFLLKARRKEKYAERQEHTGKDGGPITL